MNCCKKYFSVALAWVQVLQESGRDLMGPLKLVCALEEADITHSLFVFPRCGGPSESWNEMTFLDVMLDSRSCVLRVLWGQRDVCLK